MGVRILHDRDQSLACLYDSVTDTAFGPVFFSTPHVDAESAADCFVQWFNEEREVRPLPNDLRLVSARELEDLQVAWNRAVDPQQAEKECLLCDGLGTRREELIPFADTSNRD
jgi:hypothetical protein